MTKTIDFYFDFSSPYGYFSSETIDGLEDRCGCKIIWRPYLMGVVMKITERKPLVQIPMINDYSERDLKRVARYHGIGFNTPSTFPIATVAACRAYYWLTKRNEEQARRLAHALFRAYFIKDELISKPEVVLEVASRIGVDTGNLETALADPAVKQIVRDATDQAINQNVFGSPFFIVDGEPFWGHDRIDHLETWVKSGGW